MKRGKGRTNLSLISSGEDLQISTQSTSVHDLLEPSSLEGNVEDDVVSNRSVLKPGLLRNVGDSFRTRKVEARVDRGGFEVHLALRRKRTKRRALQYERGVEVVAERRRELTSKAWRTELFPDPVGPEMMLIPGTNSTSR